jgi:hypothetical protein
VRVAQQDPHRRHEVLDHQQVAVVAEQSGEHDERRRREVARHRREVHDADGGGHLDDRPAPRVRGRRQRRLQQAVLHARARG